MPTQTFIPCPPCVPDRISRFVLVLLLVVPSEGWSQAIRGRVMEEASGAAIPVVAVSLLSREGEVLQTVLSDGAGAFQLLPPRRDSVTVRAQRLGYRTVTSLPLALQPGELATLEIKVGRGRVWLSEDIERERPMLVRHLLDAVPGTSRTPTCSGFGYYLDGLPIELGALDVNVSVEEIEGVEIYRGPVQLPMEFYGSNLCGVMLVWRKPYGERPGGGSARSGLAFVVGVSLLLSAMTFLF